MTHLRAGGVLPAPQTMDGSAAQGAREGLLFGAFLIDVLFGDRMVPNPDIVTSGDLEIILLDLGLSADQVSRSSEMDLDDRLRLLQMILDGWTGQLGPYSDYSGIGE